MKKFSRLITVMVLVSMFAAALTGCSSDEITVFKAMNKATEIKSMEGKTSMTLRFEASGFSEEENESIQTVAQFLNNLKMDMVQKVSQNEDKTVSKAQMDMSVEVGGISTSMGIWADVDVTGTKPKIKEIIKMPAIATAVMPAQFKGKQYMVMDVANMPEDISTSAIDYKQLLELSKGFTSKMAEFLGESATKFDPGFPFITYKEGKSVDGEYLTFYELKLDDKAFKGLVKSAVNKFASDEKTLEFIMEFVKSAVKLSAANNTAALEGFDQQAEEMMNELKNGMPQYLEQFNAVMDTLKDVKLLGDKGIIINYGINNQGYIAHESGSIDLVIDFKALSKAFQASEDDSLFEDMSGVLNIGLDFSSETKNINRNIEVKFPELSSKNSFDYNELYEVLNPPVVGFYGFIPFGYNDEPIKIVIDEKELNEKFNAKVIDGSVVVPVRAVYEALGAKVRSNYKNQTITVDKGDQKIVFKMKSTKATVNGSERLLDTSVVQIDGMNYIPASFLRYSGNVDLKWNKKTKTLIITSYPEYSFEDMKYTNL